MAGSLVLSVSSTGRAPMPTGEGPTLLVDEANAVMIVVSSEESTWVPENVTLHNGGAPVGRPPMSNGTTWVLMGDDRFGTFHARATADGVVVESDSIRVVPATVFLRPKAAPIAAPVAAATHAVAPGPAARDAATTGVTSLRSAKSAGADPQVPAPPVAPHAPGPPQEAVTSPAGIPAATATPTPRAAAAVPASAATSAPTPRKNPTRTSDPESKLPEPEPTGTDAAATAPAEPSLRPQGALEVPAPEYDARFAAVVAGIYSVLALSLLFIVGAQMIGGLIVSIPIGTDTLTTAADSAARVGLATSALLIAVGSVLLLAAAALAALDLRGRQRCVTGTPPALRGAQPTLDEAPGIPESPGRHRSTFALLVTGVVVLVIGLVSQVLWS